MNDKFKKFAELCGKSRGTGMSMYLHNKKITLANELVNEGVMTIDENGCYNFVNEEESNEFDKIVNEFSRI